LSVEEVYRQSVEKATIMDIDGMLVLEAIIIDSI